MRIFVTGATGFIGSHFVNHALDAGHEVLALRRSVTRIPRISLGREPIWLTKSMDGTNGTDFAGCDVLVHLAAVGVSPQVAAREEMRCWNVEAPARMLLKAAAAGVDRWVVTGTCVEYGCAAARYEFIPADAPLEPVGEYAASKAAGGLLFQQIARSENARLSYLRLFSVFGEGQHEANLWPTIRRAARAGDDLPLTPGEQVRDFIRVEQVAVELLAAATDEGVAAGVPCVRNVGTGRPQMVREFAEHWWREFGAKGKLLFGALPYRADEVMRYVPQL